MPVTTTDPATGAGITREFGATSLIGALNALFYDASGIPYIPALVTLAAQGEVTPLAELSGGAVAGIGISQGMQYSFQCAEEFAYFDEATFEAQRAALTPLLREDFDATSLGAEVCATWGVPPADPSVFEQVRTDVPHLLVTGRYDQITPSYYGEEIAAVLPNAQLVEVAAAGHAPFGALGECGVALVRAYLANPAAPVAADCADAPIAFYLPEDGEPTPPVAEPAPSPAPAPVPAPVHPIRKPAATAPVEPTKSVRHMRG